jgi:hypothetical protein
MPIPSVLVDEASIICGTRPSKNSDHLISVITYWQRGNDLKVAVTSLLLRR